MRELIIRDLHRDLGGIESVISAIEASSTTDRLRRHCLLTPLIAERDALLRALGRARTEVPPRAKFGLVPRGFYE
jgi:hypothetical protein